jgi:hypothetical protein
MTYNVVRHNNKNGTSEVVTEGITSLDGAHEICDGFNEYEHRASFILYVVVTASSNKYGEPAAIGSIKKKEEDD